MVITNGSGATNTQKTEALLTGKLTVVNAHPTRVTVYWGKRDGGTNPSNWEHKVVAGVCQKGIFKVSVTGLKTASRYYCRFYAENPAAP